MLRKPASPLKPSQGKASDAGDAGGAKNRAIPPEAKTGSLGSLAIGSGSLDFELATLFKTLSVSSFESFKQSNRVTRVAKKEQSPTLQV